jgi:hypothetical protein
MNKEEELLLLLKQASKALADTQAELKEAKRVVAKWDSATNNPVENKTLDEWKKEVTKQEKELEDAKQREKEARAAFMAVVPQGNLFSQGIVIESKATYWRVSGTISDSLTVKGVRSRMYQNADNYLGYYESGQPALFYEENGLKINVLFKTEENALFFDSHLRNESITINSPMKNLTINAVVSTTSTAQLGERIYFKEYIPTDSESPQNTQSVITIQSSTFEETSDEFKYQRIEKLAIFGSMGKAESCHLMSGSHCRKYPSYSQFDKDPNNRLAMSRDLHGWFDHLNTKIPLFYLKVVSISESVIVEGRYIVQLAVVAFNQESADMIFCRLIEGSTQTNDSLVMNTSVYVTNPAIFQKCLEWKEKENKKKWVDYSSMDSAVP